MPHQITCASALPGITGKREKCILPLNALLVHCLNAIVCLISSMFFDSRGKKVEEERKKEETTGQKYNIRMCYRRAAIISAFSYTDYWGHGSGERSRSRCSCWAVLHAQCTSAPSSGFPISQGNVEALDK